jgi:hypothetical protein
VTTQPPGYGQTPTYGQPAAAPNNTLGLIAMILGIASLPLSLCCGAGLLFGAAGAVLGYMGKQNAAQGKATNGSQANVGFICGIIGAAISILWIILGFVANVSLIPFTN